MMGDLPPYWEPFQYKDVVIAIAITGIRLSCFFSESLDAKTVYQHNVLTWCNTAIYTFGMGFNRSSYQKPIFKHFTFIYAINQTSTNYNNIFDTAYN